MICVHVSCSMEWQGKTAIRAGSFPGGQCWLGMTEHRGRNGNLLTKKGFECHCLSPAAVRGAGKVSTGDDL